MVLLDQPPRIATMAKRAAPLNTHGQQAMRRVMWLNTASVGPPGAVVGSRPGQGRRQGARRCYSPWVPLLIGLRWYASISPQVQSLPFPCRSLDCGAACTMT
jgi:hypothetical protein